MARTFLSAEWRKLIMANYVVDPALLQPWLPAGTEHDLYEGRCYVTLAGFMFLNTRMAGAFGIPYHRHFEEVNLRFYVKREDRRGVVFISEIVPLPAVSTVARLFYGEPYRSMPMSHRWQESEQERLVEYRWKHRRWNTLQAKAALQPVPVAAGSEEEFIFEHYWGYTARGTRRTSQYEVIHPRWEVYPLTDYTVDVAFRTLYGPGFAFLEDRDPDSIFLSEGSPVTVRGCGDIVL